MREAMMAEGNDSLRLFLCGDVMPGRGIDQVLPQSCGPTLYEPWVDDARTYRRLAEAASGEIPAPVEYDYVWGDALRHLDSHAPDLRLINLETAVTCGEDAWPDKSIHYRMHPDNVPVLDAIRPDCLALANNHVLDWGYAGLSETIESLHDSGIKTAGAGFTAAGAQTPAILKRDQQKRILVFAIGAASAGVPKAWAATSRCRISSACANASATVRRGSCSAPSCWSGGNGWGSSSPSWPPPWCPPSAIGAQVTDLR